MTRTIYLRVGNRDEVTLPDLVTSLTNFLHLLRDVDANVSNAKSGSLTWQVTVLQKSSPALVGVTPTPRLHMQDHSESVETRLIKGTQALAVRGERPEFFADSVLERIEKIARQSKRLGPSAIFVNENGSPAQEVSINETTYKNVKELTGTKYEAFGSIIGKLEAISVHKRNEFRVWDEATGKPVRCKFDDDLEDRVKELLRKYVAVSGVISSNSFGNPISVVAEDIEERKLDELPTIEQMSGLVKDFTGGRSLRKYFEEIDDD